MAELVKQENDLVAIRVRLTRSGKLAVVFDVERATERRHQVEVDPAELGVPADLEDGNYIYGEPSWRMPERLIEELRREVEAAHDGQPFEVLWFHIASPSGFLTLLPWERLLSPLGVPIIRVPHFALFPPLQAAEMDIAICLSQPLAKGEFDAAGVARVVAEALDDATGRSARIHFFGDMRCYTALRDMGFDNARDGRFVIYDPQEGPVDEAPAGGPQIEDSSTTRLNPWLHWMVHVLHDRTLEMVHLITHTYMSHDQAAIAVSESPRHNEDRRQSRFVGPQQLTRFLDLMGAWSVGISTPEHNFSPMGARLLVDELAHRRAGPVLLHELAQDPGADQLGAAYRSLFDGMHAPGPSEIALYGHPRLFRDTSPEDAVVYAEALLAEPRRSASASADQPAWVTLTRRYLEQSTARIFPDTEQPTSPVQQAAAEGVRQALSFVNDLMAKYDADPASGRGVSRPRSEPERPESRS